MANRRCRVGVSRRTLLTCAPLMALAPAPLAAETRAMQFKIATGGPTGTYFRIGSLIADAVSRPPGSPSCIVADRCGVDGLVASAVTTEGSVDNIERLVEGSVQSALVQADIAFWAHVGAGSYEGEVPISSLRALASLYSEAIHLVVAEHVDATDMTGLEGLRVAVGRVGSGTRVDALLVLEAFGYDVAGTGSGTPFDMVDIGSSEAVDRFAAGEIDAFFFVGGWPVGLVSETITLHGGRLLAIEGEPAIDLLRAHSFFSPAMIPAEAYGLAEPVATLGIRALWLVLDTLPDDLAYELVRALWEPGNKAYIDQNHPRGGDIALATALEGVVIPIHEGAFTFYRERGMVGG